MLHFDKGWFKVPWTGKNVLKLLKFVRWDDGPTDQVSISSQWSLDTTEVQSDKKFNAESINNTIDQYKSIERLAFYYTYIDEETLTKLLLTNTEIHEIHFDTLAIDVSEELLIKFCLKFKSVTFKEVSLPVNLFKDEIFCKISINATFLFGNPQCDYYHCKVDQVALTDKFLYALTDERMRQELSMAFLYTECTIAGIEYLMESAYRDSFEIISWNFGFLNKREEKRADHFMKKTNKKSDRYIICKSNYEDQYTLYSVYDALQPSRLLITFCVVNNDAPEWAIH